jgi:hypothetical protein
MATYCFMESCCCFVVKEKSLQLEGKVKALGTCNLMQMKKISVLKLTKQLHESWQLENVCLAHCLRLVISDWCVLVFVNT